MVKKLRVAPPNSLIFIEDRSGGVTPDIDGVGGIWATPSCVAISTFVFCDGKTDVTIGEFRDVRMQKKPTYDVTVDTPSAELKLKTSEDETLHRERVQANKTRVRIWTNHPDQPDKIVIGLG